MGQRPGWGQLDGGIEKRDPLPHPQMKRSRASLLWSLSVQLLKGRMRTAGWGFFRFHPEMRHDRWPAWRSHAFQNYSHPRSVCTDTHTHSDLICFPSPCGDWNIHISHKQHTHSPIVGYPSQSPSCIFTHLTFSPSSQKWVKRKSFCCVAQTGFECCISNQSQLCQGIFLKLFFPFFLIFGGGKAKIKINTFYTVCLRFITQPQSGAGESAKS